jgi:hypothetical protein
MDILPDDLLNKISKNVLNFQNLKNLKQTCKTFNKIITKFKIKILIFNILYKKSISYTGKTIDTCVNSGCSEYGDLTWKPCGFNPKGTMYIPYCFKCANNFGVYEEWSGWRWGEDSGWEICSPSLSHART